METLTLTGIRRTPDAASHAPVRSKEKIPYLFLVILFAASGFLTAQEIELPWVRIPTGSFNMGCVPEDLACLDTERPRHHVTISAFDLMRNEITIEQYATFLNHSGHRAPPLPDFEQGPDHPVVFLTWNDAAAFCEWAGGRLPTEAEWEYSARANHDGRIFWWGNEVSREFANFGAEECCGGAIEGADIWLNTSPVGSFPANAFGLYGMTGNVWEWVDAWITRYPDEPVQDPQPLQSGFLRVMRGGSWLNIPNVLRLSVRLPFDSGGRTSNTGARCARDAVGLVVSAE